MPVLRSKVNKALAARQLHKRLRRSIILQGAELRNPRVSQSARETLTPLLSKEIDGQTRLLHQEQKNFLAARSARKGPVRGSIRRSAALLDALTRPGNTRRNVSRVWRVGKNGKNGA